MIDRRKMRNHRTGGLTFVTIDVQTRQSVHRSNALTTVREAVHYHDWAYLRTGLTIRENDGAVSRQLL